MMELKDPRVPDGFIKLDSYAVYTDGKDIVILGTPADEEEYEEPQHDCDWMNCAWEHVIATAKVTQIDCNYVKK